MADSKGSNLPDGDSTATLSSIVIGVVSGVTSKISISKILSLLTDSAVTSKLLTGFSSSIGTVSATDTILQAFNKLSANVLQTSCTQAPDATVSSGTHTFDCNYGGQKITATGNFTLAFSNIPAGVMSNFVINAYGWGSYTITLPAHEKVGATTFTFTAKDEIVCRFDKDGNLRISVAAVN